MSTTQSGNPDDVNASAFSLDLPRAQKVVLVVDLVESVRLMELNEANVVSAWREFVSAAKDAVLAPLQGRLVKSLGDGLMAEFDSVLKATRAALDLHVLMAKINANRPHTEPLQLRAGLHSTEVYIDDIDIYGSGVNLAARIATLAGPGETVVTSPVRDHITDGIDAQIEDLGECYLKHIEQPVRAYRVGAAGAAPVLAAQSDYNTPLQPTIAVIPFDALTIGSSVTHEHLAIGDIIADGVIAQLSRSSELRVLSRLSCNAFRGALLDPQAIRTHLGASFLLSGNYVLSNKRLMVSVELADTQTREVIWADRLRADIGELFEPDSELCHTIAQATQREVLNTEVKKALSQPLPTLHSSSLMIAAINLMHHSSSTDAMRSHAMLEHLQTRHQRHASPSSWLANWYALRVTQGQSQDAVRDTQLALSYAQHAIDANNASTLAISIYGVLLANLNKDMEGALKQLDHAVQLNPNEALGWLYKGLIHAFRAEAEQASAAADTALALTPVNPMRHYIESIAASCALGAGDYDKAIALSNSSLRVNQLHPSTYRTLATALVLNDQVKEARAVITDLLKLTPGYRTSDFLSRSGFSTGPHAQNFANALSSAGVPD
jgi:adenylate cyclase